MAAFSFMTRIPTQRIVAHDIGDLPASVTYFPLVGFTIGFIAALTYAVTAQFWSLLIAVLLSTVMTVWITGAFHEDALADSLDGFGGGWTSEQVLSIMKDSRVGSYALVGVWLVLALKVAALLSIASAATGGTSVTVMLPGTPPNTLHAVLPMSSALIAAHTLARCSSVLLLYSEEYVRAPSTADKPASGSAFTGAVTRAHLAAALTVTLATVALLFGFSAIAMVVVASTVTFVAARYFRRRIGGITGDALGAANQLVELSVYLVIAAHPASGFSL